MVNAISFRDVTVEYETMVALNDVSFDIEKGEFVGIIGSNGSGKTTLLKTALGMIRPSKGRIEILGKELFSHLSEIRKKIGYVPQKTYINPKMPILAKDVVLMGRYGHIGLLRMPRKKDYNMAKKALMDVDMYDKRNEPFGHLSGGQQQRIYIARALVQEPEIMLLDEPTTGLDVRSQRSIISLLDRLHRERGLTIMLVTHDVNSISDVVDRVMYLRNRLIAFGEFKEVCRQDILEQVYSVPVKIVREEGKPCVIVSDQHVH